MAPLRKPWRITTVRSGSPLTRAKAKYGEAATATMLSRTTRLESAARPSAKVSAGSVSSRQVPKPAGGSQPSQTENRMIRHRPVTKAGSARSRIAPVNAARSGQRPALSPAISPMGTAIATDSASAKPASHSE